MEKIKQLGEGKIGSLLFKYSMPAIIGMLANALYNVVDRIFIGRGVGTLAIAGLTVVFPIMIVSMGIGLLIGSGSSINMAIKFGEEKREEAEKFLGNAFILSVISSVMLTAVTLIFIHPVLIFFGASASVLPYAKDYLAIIALGFVFQIMAMGLGSSIRVQGHPKTGMFTMIIGAVLNAIFCPIFIFGFKMGVRGAAFATVLSQFFSLLYVLWFYTSRMSILRIKLGKSVFDSRIIKKIISLGFAPFFVQVMNCIVFIVANNSIKVYGGDTALAVIGIINTLIMLILMPVLGLDQGAMPLISYNFGAKKYERILKILKMVIVISTVILALWNAAILIFPAQLLSLFNGKDHELVGLGSRALMIYCGLIFLNGIYFTTVHFFQAIGKSVYAILLAPLKNVIISLLFIILPLFLKINGIFISGIATDIICTAVAIILLAGEVKKIKNMQMMPEGKIPDFVEL